MDSLPSFYFLPLFPFLINATSPAWNVFAVRRYQSVCWGVWPQSGWASSIRQAASPAPSRMMSCKGITSSPPRLAARWATMPALLPGSSADPADSIWAWGGDRGASISNLIPHARWKEPILSRQRRASCYIDFYINHKGQPGPQQARLWREDKVPPLPSWLAICGYSSAKIPASSRLTISPFRPVGSPFCVQWLPANLQLMDLILGLSRSQSAQAQET